MGKSSYACDLRYKGMFKHLSRPPGFGGPNHTTLSLGRAQVVLIVGAEPVEVDLDPSFVEMLAADGAVLVKDPPKVARSKRNKTKKKDGE